MREFDALRMVRSDLPYTLKPCRHGYTFCLGEPIAPQDRRGEGLQFYDGDHYIGSIGFMELTPRRDLNVLYINLLGVEEEYRGQHYSGAMVDWALLAAQALRLSKVEVPDAIGLDDESMARMASALEHRGFAQNGKSWMKRIRIERSSDEMRKREYGSLDAITSRDLRDRPGR